MFKLIFILAVSAHAITNSFGAIHNQDLDRTGSFHAGIVLEKPVSLRSDIVADVSILMNTQEAGLFMPVSVTYYCLASTTALDVRLTQDFKLIHSFMSGVSLFFETDRVYRFSVMCTTKHAFVFQISIFTELF